MFKARYKDEGFLKRLAHLMLIKVKRGTKKQVIGGLVTDGWLKGVGKELRRPKNMYDTFLFNFDLQMRFNPLED